MGGGSAGVSTAISEATLTLKDFGMTQYLNQTRIAGLSGETYYTLATINGEKFWFDFQGVGYRISSYANGKIGGVISGNNIGTIHFSDEGSSAGTIIVGAGGSGFTGNANDEIKAGSGNDLIVSTALVGGSIIHGGGGNDLIVGSYGAGDSFYGDGGNDVFICRGISAHYDGGADNDTLSYYNLNSGIVVDGAAHTITQRGTQDTFDSIETIIGTRQNDKLILGGSVNFIAGWGSDTFVGVPSTGLDGGRGIDTLDMRLASGVVLDTRLTPLESIEIIYGSNSADVFTSDGGAIFKNTESGMAGTILGFGGNDVIEMRGSVNIDAGADDDKVIVLSGGYGYLRGGTGIDTLDFTQVQASSLTVVFAGDSSTYRINSGDAHTFTGFEQVRFGSVPLTLLGTGTFTGGTGQNKIYGSDGIEDITVNGTGGWVQARGGDDVIHSYGLESVYGEMGNDRLFASDTVGGKLYGGVFPDQAVTWVNDGDDFLQGGALSDILDGGTGSNEMHGGGGYDHFYSNGYGENVVYGDADGGDMHINLTSTHQNQSGAILASIHDMGGWFDVTSTSDHGQTFRHDSLYDIDKLYLLDATFDLRAGLHYDTGLFMI